MKKFLTTSLAAVIGITAVTLLSSCNRGGGNSGIDKDKTQLYIMNYQGGYGNKWLYHAKESYEALHANDSYEPGKKGVQIMITDQKNYPTPASVKTGTDELFFFENTDFNSFYAEGAFADITRFVTGTNPYETTKTIESKLSSGQKSYLTKEIAGETKYFALPHYMSSFGITYNRAVFESRGYYFASDYKEFEPGSDDRFVGYTVTKSKGPDGIANTEDDGLPVTFDEFFELCEYVKSNGDIPFTYYLKGDYNYLGYLACSIAADYNGLTEDMVNYTMDGEIEVVKMNGDCTDVLYEDADHKVVQTERVTVHPDIEGINDGKGDGFEVQRQAGKFYGLSFLNRLVSEYSRNNYRANNVTTSSTQFDVQNYFIDSQFGRYVVPGETTRPNIAMMFEGDWWYSEANAKLNKLSDVDKSKIDYGWMPLPRPFEDANHKPTIVESTRSLSYIKAGLPAFKENLAGDFMQYMNTDESLRDFTVTTNAKKALTYELTSEDENKLSSFGKSYIAYTQKADLSNPVSQNKQFAKYLASAELPRRYNTQANVLGFPTSDFQSNKNLTAGQYLAAMYKNYKTSIWKVEL